MADDLDPAAVERATVAFVRSMSAAGFVMPGASARPHARAALAAARAGEAEPVLDGQCGNTMVVRCWAWCGRAPGHEGECEVGGVTARVHGAPAATAQRGGEAVGREAEGAIPDDLLARPLVQALLAARGDAPVRSVSAEQRLALARVFAAARSGAEHVAFYEAQGDGSPMWRQALAEADAGLTALRIEVTP
ncbi:hypothetical protein [Cellulomonas sp.]|uniref:hypothetical protein n=1 Tax=Cellulomonas sp. TaxID=40001 RepID=UPI001B1CDC5D|nr:hypothetical protein [Cellulomonas sp.]MBO9555589.1 hypothetical protein [Cellulomonas sp.]